MCGRAARTLVVAAVLSLVSVVAAPPRPALADVVSAAQMMQLHNELRFAIGAPTLTPDPRVVTAAQNHANYNSANGVGGHFETAGRPYYTGYAPRDRVAAAGLVTSFVSEVATGGSSALGGVRQLWDAPYHRLGLMHPSAATAGWGHSDLNGRGTTVADITYNFGLRPVEFVRSPTHRQTNVPTSWSGNESPSPLPTGVRGPVGYPIMVVYAGAPPVDMRGAEIVRPDGSRVPIYYAPQYYERDYQVIIPQAPLAANTTYHVRFDITVAGNYVTNEWDFSTGATIAGAAAPDTGFHAAWVDQSPTVATQPAATQSVTMRFRNTGTKTWTRGVAGSQVALGVLGDSTAYSAMGMSSGWPSANRVAIQSEASVAPGGIASFTFGVRSPFSAGLVQMRLRPVVDGVAWLEDQGVFVSVLTVVDYHAAWFDQSPYPTLRAGQISGPLFIRFRNSGSQAWVKGLLGQEARLAVNRDNTLWAGLGVNWMSANRVTPQAESVVPPGGTATFMFQIRAPGTPGTYAIHLRPVIDGVTWMEDYGVFLHITVVP